MTRPNKTYQKEAIRFLKAANILPYWITYIESKEHNNHYEEHHERRHWSDKIEECNIFGETQFTDYLTNVCNIKVGHFDLCCYTYQVFEEYLRLLKHNGEEEARKFASDSFVKFNKN